MRKTSTCPKCEQPITLVDASQASQVECPLCQERFELAEALESATEAEEGSIPPQLIVIEGSEDEDLGAFFADLVADESTELEPSETEASDEEAPEKMATDEPPFGAGIFDDKDGDEEESEKAEDLDAFFAEVVAEEETSEDDAAEEDASEEEAFEELTFDEETPGEETSEGEASGKDASEEETSEVLAFDEEGSDGTTTEEESEGDEFEKEASEDGSSEEQADDDLTLAEEPAIQVRCPCCMDSFDLEDLLLAETNRAVGAEAASAILADGSVREPADSAGGVQLDFGAVAAADQDHTGFSLESSEETPSASAGAFEFAAAVGDDADPAEKSEAARAQRRRRERGGMKDLLGAALGGAAGLLITYYCLNLFGGARFDMLKVYLPFVKHTAVHRPGWLGGPPEEEEFDSGIGNDMGLGEAPSEPKEPKQNGQEKKQEPPVEEPTEEPATEPMPPEEEPVPSNYVGVLDQPAVTSDSLGQSLRRIDDLKEAGPLTEEGYEEWCRVAEAATFIELKDGNPQTQNRLDEMRRQMKGLSLADITKIGDLATKRTGNPDRANNGILFAGRARETNVSQGKGYVTEMVMAGTFAQVSIASDRRLPIKPDDRVLVVGYLVDDPEEATEGLDTELSQIIWVRTVVKFGGK